MPVQVVRLRERAGYDSGVAAQVMPVPSYLRALLHEDAQNEPDIVLVFKVRTNASTSSLPLDVRDEVNVSSDSNIELGGDPLPAPFSDCDEFEESLFEKRQCLWPKGELNHCPLRLQDALNLLCSNENPAGESSDALDVWCLVGDGAFRESELQGPSVPQSILDFSQTENLLVLDGEVTSYSLESKMNSPATRVLLGLHNTEGWWTRSYVEAQKMCSLGSPEMDPHTMKQRHLDIAILPDKKTNVVVSCRYNISGKQMTPEDHGSSVRLELKWRQPTLLAPHDASAKLIIQAAVGSKSSSAFDLWKQLSLLNELFEVLLNCWRDKTTPDALPFLSPGSAESLNISSSSESLDTRLQTLILGGQQAFQAQNANRRMSLAPGMQGRLSLAPSAKARQSIAPGFLGRLSIAPGAMKETADTEKEVVSLTNAVESVVIGTRENSDVTDGLFSLLIECKTYRQLREAWDLVFMELNKGCRPFIRPKNSTRAAKLIHGFLTGQLDNNLEFLEMEGSLYPLELLIELGLEKLTTDYHYVFLESQLIGRDELHAPQLVRAGLGVARDKMFASWGDLLGWLAQVHCALEILLPLQECMSSTTFPYMAPKPLKYYQSEMSPVKSVAGLLSPSNSLLEFSFSVNTNYIQEHVNDSKSFDWWKMTLTSENEMRRVRSIYLRSHLRPIFPPQLYESYDTQVPVEGVENIRYHCAEAVTISQIL